MNHVYVDWRGGRSDIIFTKKTIPLELGIWNMMVQFLQYKYNSWLTLSHCQLILFVPRFDSFMIFFLSHHIGVAIAYDDIAIGLVLVTFDLVLGFYCLHLHLHCFSCQSLL
jgi:hypothetical protein